jgi:pSer/pThr/pTyr-binding forkhead associated (FHA) protein
MCGSALASSHDGAEESERNGESTRVRQRTVHSQTSDMHDAVKRIREEFQGNEEVESKPQSVEEGPEKETMNDSEENDAPRDSFSLHDDEGDLDLVDPLSAFLEEVDEDDASSPSKAAESTQENSERSQSPANADNVRPMQARDREVESAKRSESGANKDADQAAARESRDTKEEKGTDRRSQDKDVSAKGSSTGDARGAGSGSGRESSPSTRENASRAVVQTGMSRKGGKLAFRDKQQSQEQRPDREDRQRPASRDDRSRDSRPEQRGTESRAGRESQQGQQSRRQDSQPARQSTQQSAQRRVEVDGRLSGWLVSYAVSAGEATELREGRFFVTQQSLKESDFIIDDPSVSTPHALVKVEVGNGCVVQDLMSERGVFIRRRGSDTYARMTEESITLVHGDWVRFGDVEYLVSLIAHVGEE